MSNKPELVKISKGTNPILWCKENAPKTAFRWGWGYIWIEPKEYEPESLEILYAALNTFGFVKTLVGPQSEQWELDNWVSLLSR